ncbi:degradation-enhancing alpha-mannosidase 2 [Octopus vulgaris]|uniref:alpha-1,2-Mannosidase n=1 Tax=Octopus vulgaris TaxID=6645 RepID=A0AA36B293_OCTVU|nr:degradation-enhancing alpha-mannosidase 2 [Octopus vulgaris]
MKLMGTWRSSVTLLFFFLLISPIQFCQLRKFTKQDLLGYKKRVVDMFNHAYESYMQYAYPLDELRPLTCDGHDTWGSFSLTLIDALDMLAIIGNYTEFRRVAKLVLDSADFDTDINASVFETNIRVVAGLLSSHLLSKKAGMETDPGWPCSGPLLDLAENMARRLLPAFDTPTGMPYGTINLRHGVPAGETTVTCTAGVGTFIVEFGTLSRLTGDPIFENAAMRAMKSLWNFRSDIDLFGNHIDVRTGRWTALDMGIGAGVDSYLEYLVKGSIMFNSPEMLAMFNECKVAIEKYLKRDDWYMWGNMKKGSITLPVFTSLDCYWPGIQSLLGDNDSAMKTILNFHQVWKQFGFVPEFYNIPKADAHANREGYPLRPELIESTMYLYQATKDPYLLQIGVDMLESIEQVTKTRCGFATVKDVTDHRLENRMESFFLAETLKYMYLLFTPDHFIHNNGSRGEVIETTYGECVIDAGGYVFNTEGHPIDVAAVHCCSAVKKKDDDILFKLHDNLDLLALLGATDEGQHYGGQKWEKKRKDQQTENSDTGSESNSEDSSKETGDSSGASNTTKSESESSNHTSSISDKTEKDKENVKINIEIKQEKSSPQTDNRGGNTSILNDLNVDENDSPVKDSERSEEPNIADLYKSLKDFEIGFKAPYSLLYCPAQPFHMKLSVMGEMFENRIGPLGEE